MDVEVLKYAVENGIVDLSYIREKIEMNKRNRILEEHGGGIWQGKNGKWYAYLPDKEKGRKMIKRNRLKDVEDVVVGFWTEEEENPRIDEIFEEWMEKKLERGEIQKSTRDRYRRQYEESFSEFGKLRIKDISPMDVEDFMLASLQKHKMTSKGFGNFRTLVFGIFKYAKKKRLVDFSITETVNDMEISRKAFRKNVKTERESVFMDDELPVILKYLESHSDDIINIGLLLMFKSGLRVGELSSLRCEDVNGNVLKVSRTEICYEENGKRIFEVRNFPKTEAGIREVVIPEKYEPYIEKAIEESSGEYLFERNGERIRTYQFRNKLKTICKKTDIVSKSPHKVRKTYATILFDNGVSDSVILSQMGHTDIKTTKAFYQKKMASDQTKQRIINSLPEY